MYGFTTTLTGITFDQAIDKTTAALKSEGFGVLSERRSAPAELPMRSAPEAQARQMKPVQVLLALRFLSFVASGAKLGQRHTSELEAATGWTT